MFVKIVIRNISCLPHKDVRIIIHKYITVYMDNLVNFILNYFLIIAVLLIFIKSFSHRLAYNTTILIHPLLNGLWFTSLNHFTFYILLFFCKSSLKYAFINGLV